MDTKKKYVTEYRKITLKTADGATIQGNVNIGLRERVSQLFTDNESQFLVLTDAIMREGDAKIMFINKNHIIWAEPEEGDDV
jgi:hypothetical protein